MKCLGQVLRNPHLPACLHSIVDGHRLHDSGGWVTLGGVWSDLGLRTDKIKNLNSRQGGRSRVEVEESVCGGPVSHRLLRLGLLRSVEGLVKEQLCLRELVQPAQRDWFTAGLPLLPVKGGGQTGREVRHGGTWLMYHLPPHHQGDLLSPCSSPDSSIQMSLAECTSVLWLL